MALAKKYLFGLEVIAYLFSVIGVPVYLHYCGGELEKVNFMVKATSCCGEEDESEDAGDCCKDEGAYVQNTTDFTLKQLTYWFAQLPSGLFTQLFLFPETGQAATALAVAPSVHPPPNLLTQQLVSTSVLRI